MQLNHATIFLMSLIAGTALAVPLQTARQSSVDGQACTDGDFDGTCRADGRCGLELPPNELSFQFIQGQCGIGGNSNAGNKNNGNNNNGGNAVADDDDNNSDDAEDNAAAFEGQACTDGQFDGTCQASGRCGLNLPPNEFSQQFISGQCGQ